MHDRFTAEQIAAILHLPVAAVRDTLMFGAPPAPRIVDHNLTSWFDGAQAAWHLGVTALEWQRALVDHAIAQAEAQPAPVQPDRRPVAAAVVAVVGAADLPRPTGLPLA